MSLSQRRRGRPRLSRPKIDKGTKELRLKRRRLLENGKIQDTSLTESLLGIFYAHEFISKPLYEAGRFFGELGYRHEPCLEYVCWRRVSGLNAVKRETQRRGHSSFPEEQEQRMTQAWRKALKALKDSGHLPYRTVLKIVFYAGDVYSTPLPVPLLRELGALQQGLRSLEKHFKEEWRDRRGRLDDLALDLALATRPQPSLKELQPFAPL